MSIPSRLTDGTPKIAKAAKPPRDRTHWLYISVIVAIIAGIVLGILAPDVAAHFKILGTSFVDLIKMIVPPVIFCTIVLGIGSVRAAASVGKAGGLALAYFIVMSTFALFAGLLVGNLLQPDTGLNIETQSSGGDGEEAGLATFVAEIIPDSFFSAFTGSTADTHVSILQVLFIALLVGFATQSLGEKGEPILAFVSHLQRLIFKILSWILWLAPIGAFGAIAHAVGSTGLSVVLQLGYLMLAFYITCLVFIFVILGAVLKIFTGHNIFRLCKYLAREYLIIFATSSSESALPNLMRKMEHLGVQKSTVGIVVPTGYSFNLDGTAIYLTMSAIFISDAMGMPMSVGEQLALLVFMIIAAKGAAGVSGAGIATLAAGLQSYKPALLGGVDMLLGIDKFMSEARALTNFAGNSVATLLVGQWTHTVDNDQVRRVLHGEDPYQPSASDDQRGSFRRGPSIVNPAQDRLQPTPQLNLDAYQRDDAEPER